MFIVLGSIADCDCLCQGRNMHGGCQAFLLDLLAASAFSMIHKI